MGETFDRVVCGSLTEPAAEKSRFAASSGDHGSLAFSGELRVEVVPAREDVVVARAVRELLADP